MSPTTPGTRRAALALIAASAASLSCDGRRTTLTAPPAGAVTVEASAADVVLLVRVPSDGAGRAASGGTSAQLSLMVENPEGHDLPRKRHSGWTTSDSAVVTVDSTGLLTAVDTGSAMVVAHHKYAADTVRVRVAPVPVATVAVAPATLSVFLGDTTEIVATPLDSAGEALPWRTLAFAAAAPSIAGVEAIGPTTDGTGVRARVIGLGLGTTRVRATAANDPATGVADATGEAEVTVLPQPVQTVVIAPDAPVMTVDDTLRLAASAYDRFGNLLADRAITWRSLDGALASVSTAGLVTSLDPGPARIVAASEGVEDTVRVQMNLPVEARALWVNRFEWTTEQDIVTIMTRAKQGNLNVVFFQVRGTGDAFYYSDLEPCAVRLCNGLGNGKAPWDPLAVAVREAHARGLELHAWVNANAAWAAGAAGSFVCNSLRASTGTNPQHMLLAHPEWAMVSSGGVTMSCTNSAAYEYAYVSPGNPAVRTHLARVTADIARRYDVDGIHLDRIRYPGQFHSSDAVSLAAFRAQYGRNPTSSTADAQWVAWRQERVNLEVKEVHDSVYAAKPSVAISAAVWSIYDNRTWGWPSSSGLTQFWQDPRAWGREGSLDIQVPMTYFNINATYCSYVSGNPDWACLLDDHLNNFDRANGRMTWIGIGADRDTAQMWPEIRLGRQRGVKGFSFYSYGQMNSRNRWPLLAAGLFKRPATVPPMTWRGEAPAPVMLAARAAVAGAPPAGRPKARPRRPGGMLSLFSSATGIEEIAPYGFVAEEGWAGEPAHGPEEEP